MQAKNYRRQLHGPGLVSWIYEYWNHEPISNEGVGCGLEIGVQLQGEWYHRGTIRGEDLFEPGEIERSPQRELYVVHYAELARMHPETFTRKFKRRYGTTPIHYRLECRLNEAALLTWSRPELSVDEIGERVGFNDRAFFYRVNYKRN